MVVHTCNPSYLLRRGLPGPLLKNNLKAKGLGHGSSGRALAWGPEFNP
jgi:hypothetical protein